ncbi:MAG: protein kinase [Acidobacteriota bacterium]
MIGQALSHYQILQKLGAGGMAEVYLAEDIRLGRRVALKLLSVKQTQDKDLIGRFEREARAASTLNHPNIVTIHETGQIDGVYFIAAEYIEGETLRRRLARSQLSLSETLEIALQVASALKAAHQAGIVHRDIKPENIMIRPDGYVKVLDFGLVKLSKSRSLINSDGEADTIIKTDPNIVLGTLQYMSPEQARGLVLDERTDIFSLGVVLYEMVAGRQPFHGITGSDLLVAILDREPPPLINFSPQAPAELLRIISKALSKNLAQRYQTVKELLIDLKNLKQQLTFETALERGGERPRETIAELPSTTTSDTSNAQTRISLRMARRSAKIALALFVIILASTTGYFAYQRVIGKPPVHSPRRLAVMSFRNLKPDAETDFLGFSLADAIITKLGYVSALIVRPSSAIDKYRNQMLDAKQVATELSVDTLLLGSYLKEGEELRITVQLIDANSNEILWRDTINVKYERLLTVQDQVADKVVKGLSLRLTAAEVARIKRDMAQDPLAYEYYLRGRDLMVASNYRLAVEMLEKSVRLDPNYALAWTFLGQAYSGNATREFGGRDNYIKAQQAYHRALELNPEQIEARVLLARLYTETGRVEEAVPILKEVIKNHPNSGMAHWDLSYAYRYAGMLMESIQEGEDAFQLNSEVGVLALNSYFYAGQYEKFVRSLPHQDNAYFSFYRGLGYYYLEDWEEAKTAFNRAYEFDSSASIYPQIGKALSYNIDKQQQTGLMLLKSSEKRIEERGVADGETIYKLAQAYAVLGDQKAALRLLARTIEAGFFCYPYFTNDKLLINLRQEAEFHRLMEQARQRHEEFKRKFFGQ